MVLWIYFPIISFINFHIFSFIYFIDQFLKPGLPTNQNVAHRVLID